MVFNCCSFSLQGVIPCILNEVESSFYFAVTSFYGCCYVLAVICFAGTVRAVGPSCATIKVGSDVACLAICSVTASPLSTATILLPPFGGNHTVLQKMIKCVSKISGNGITQNGDRLPPKNTVCLGLSNRGEWIIVPKRVSIHCMCQIIECYGALQIPIHVQVKQAPAFCIHRELEIVSCVLPL